MFAGRPAYQPLAERLRPQCLTDFVGQSHLVAPGRAIERALAQQHLHSMIFWGPPGTGKTSLARLIAQQSNRLFLALSAVLDGVKEVRKAVEQAQAERELTGQPALLFVDEVHRFNKAQQDAFLPYVEDGTVIFIGATTENPSFELNRALLSRARVYVLDPLTQADLLPLIDRAVDLLAIDLGQGIILEDDAKTWLLNAAEGDARRLLNALEQVIDFAENTPAGLVVKADICRKVIARGLAGFDKQGDAFYDQISALHKSIRGSDPQAALYWLTRMLAGGADPRYLARRLIRMASEEIGNADPRALSTAIDAAQAYERLGSPEGDLALAQAATYLAVAPKSNAVYVAYNQALSCAKQTGALPVPKHLRNAPTELMKQLDVGAGYRYAHDEPDAFAAGECYFPDAMSEQVFYQPAERGLEIKINAKMTELAELNRQSSAQRRKKGTL
ncbi:replication-associated recombination protein A [Thiomicrospira cyclica]|uniref:Replication-associated recombination protein A n=1 Tax=Thiomicrospira cyclica (strain DSM 14477 / JCM 11371 / ALM1) TaxID=717773 RepID=F6DD12_THICA|nr:replication-associated recombination protein A [Thiomicrospira cyclica]AEG31748.1 AAA ATPase central domain protein [Thiomicrospira cyclica ALM1]